MPIEVEFRSRIDPEVGRRGRSEGMAARAPMPKPSCRVRLSPKFQVEIPPSIRRRLGLRAGAELHAFVLGGRLELVPVRRLRDLRGFLEGIDTRVPRGPDRA